CVGVLIMRKKMPDAPRAFRTPLVPFVPIAGIAVCLFMMVFLPLDTWIRLIVWMMIGFDLYLFYGMKNSILNKGMFNSKSYKAVSGSGLGMVLALVVVAMIHHDDPNLDDHILYYFSMAFAVLHVFIYGYSYKRSR
ncbi:MAG TPA: amino acid permease C-terminal domain-containing protein, partial [Flavobacterium sp.]